VFKVCTSYGKLVLVCVSVTDIAMSVEPFHIFMDILKREREREITISTHLYRDILSSKIWARASPPYSLPHEMINLVSVVFSVCRTIHRMS